MMRSLFNHLNAEDPEPSLRLLEDSGLAIPLPSNIVDSCADGYPDIVNNLMRLSGSPLPWDEMRFSSDDYNGFDVIETINRVLQVNDWKSCFVTATAWGTRGQTHALLVTESEMEAMSEASIEICFGEQRAMLEIKPNVFLDKNFPRKPLRAEHCVTELANAMNIAVEKATHQLSEFVAPIIELAHKGSDHDEVKQVGFGRFTMRVTEARLGRHPRTGESIAPPSSRPMTFKPAFLAKEATDANDATANSVGNQPLARALAQLLECKDYDAVEVSSLGRFIRKEKKERMGRNPRTGEEIVVPGRVVVELRPTRHLQTVIDSNAAD